MLRPRRCFGSGTTKPTNVSASYDTTGHTYIFNSTGCELHDQRQLPAAEFRNRRGTVATGSNSCSGSGSTFTVGFGAVATPSGGASSSAANMAAALNLSGCTNLGMTATSTATNSNSHQHRLWDHPCRIRKRNPGRFFSRGHSGHRNQWLHEFNHGHCSAPTAESRLRTRPPISRQLSAPVTAVTLLSAQRLRTPPAPRLR